MTGLNFVIAAFVVALLVFAIAWGAPILAIPIVLIVAVVGGLIELRRRQVQTKDMHDHRERAKAESVEFTRRDRETLTH